MGQSPTRIWSHLDRIKDHTEKGVEYWRARALLNALGYRRWEEFQKLIQRAIKACKTSGINPSKHFRLAPQKVKIGCGAERKRIDYFLTRYACYLITMNGNPGKPEIGIAQTYFALQTRRMEVRDRELGMRQRVDMRRRVRQANKHLSDTAHSVGVQRFGLFQAAGYLGLYDQPLDKIKSRKGLRQKENLLDRAGLSELAMNAFRITQTDEKLGRDGIKGEKYAIDTHKAVGRTVRRAVQKSGNRLPEDLPPEVNIKELEKQLDTDKRIEG